MDTGVSLALSWGEDYVFSHALGLWVWTGCDVRGRGLQKFHVAPHMAQALPF